MGGLNASELREVLRDPEFGMRLRGAADATTDTGLEAGFVVRRDGSGTVSYSDLILPDSTYIRGMEDIKDAAQRDPQRELTLATQILLGSTALPHLNMDSAVLDPEGKLRTDLVIVSRALPLTPLGRRRLTGTQTPWSVLIPTVHDLAVFGAYAARNPDIITANATTHRSLGGTALFLQRASHPDALARRIEAIPDPEQAHNEDLSGFGILTALVTFDRHTGEPIRGLDTVGSLYMPTH